MSQKRLMPRALTIISGSINSGKTSRIHDIYRSTREGDGFVSLKSFDGPLHVGYELTRLSTGSSRPLARWGVAAEHDSGDGPILGPYQFVEGSFLYAERIVHELVRDGVTPVYLDEIGLLELRGRGFHQLLHTLLAATADLYLTVRDSYLEEMLQLFNITNPRLITLPDKEIPDRKNIFSSD